MKMRFSRSQLCIPYSLFLILFVIFPLLILLFYGFTDATGAITLKNFGRFFSNPTAISTMLISIGLGLITTAICLLLAYPVAYILARSQLRKRNVLLLLFIMPMWINFVLRINALKEMLDLLGMLGKNNFLNTVLGMVYDFLPFMILPLYTTLIKLDKSLLEASADLGATKSHTFFKVIFPLSMPGIVSGITMVFMPTMTSYVISDTLGLGHVTIIGKQIEQYFIGASKDWHMGSTIAFILLVIIFVTTLVSGKFRDSNLEQRGARLW